MAIRRSIILAFSVLMSAPIVSAQNGAPGNPGCGDPKVKFDVTTGDKQHLAKANADQALVYFVQDDSRFETRPRPTTRVGLDGVWIGATGGNSFLAFPVTQGMHHLCASWQGSSPGRIAASVIGAGSSYTSREGAMSFTAEAGGVYYFVVQNVYHLREEGRPILTELRLSQVNSDEGQLLVNRRKLSIAKKK